MWLIFKLNAALLQWQAKQGFFFFFMLKISASKHFFLHFYMTAAIKYNEIYKKCVN